MLDDFKDNTFYQYAINLKKIYHAYLFEVDDIDETYKIVLAFAKMIICPNHYTNNEKCNECNICHLIDNNTYSDFKIIEPDGATIKKEQILSLQQELSLKSSNNTNQVYIIKEAHKMNPSASNSLLKFIEEPKDGIFGILITNDRKQMLGTILSRCNLITLKSDNKVNYDIEEFETIVSFLQHVFKDKEKAIPYIKQEFLNYYSNREEVLKAFNIIEFILDSLIQIHYKNNIFLNDNLCDIIKTKLNEFSTEEIINFLEKTVIYKNKLINIPSINLNLFMDRYLIELSEVLK